MSEEQRRADSAYNYLDGRSSRTGQIAGKRFCCLERRGEGLFELRKLGEGEVRVVRFDLNGVIVGAFAESCESDRLIYDRASGFGDEQEAEKICSEVVGALETCLVKERSR